jgi:hypothetical protein
VPPPAQSVIMELRLIFDHNSMIMNVNSAFEMLATRG